MRRFLGRTLVLLSLPLATAAFAADTATAPDWTLTPKVKLELLDKLGADALHINVESHAGAVQLLGNVDKRATKELAGNVAKSVAGVKSVDNELTLEPAKQPEGTMKKGMQEAESEVKDAMLESRVRIALVEKLGGDGFKVGTEVASGVVTLEFDRAATQEQRSAAVTATQGVSGVAKVVTLDKNS